MIKKINTRKYIYYHNDVEIAEMKFINNKQYTVTWLNSWEICKVFFKVVYKLEKKGVYMKTSI